MKANALVVIALCAVASAAWGGAEVSVSGAWIREAPPGAPALAGYMAVENRGDADTALIGARANAFSAIMIHRTVYAGGLARMEHVERVELPAAKTLEFSPGGYHLMLMSPVAALRRGDRVEIVLEFSGGHERVVPFEVRPDAAGVQGHAPD